MMHDVICKEVERKKQNMSQRRGGSEKVIQKRVVVL